jgi:hypothetical protein
MFLPPQLHGRQKEFRQVLRRSRLEAWAVQDSTRIGAECSAEQPRRARAAGQYRVRTFEGRAGDRGVGTEPEEPEPDALGFYGRVPAHAVATATATATALRVGVAARVGTCNQRDTVWY